VNDAIEHAEALALPDRHEIRVDRPAIARHVDHPDIIEGVAREILQRQFEDRLVARAAIRAADDL